MKNTQVFKLNFSDRESGALPSVCPVNPRFSDHLNFGLKSHLVGLASLSPEQFSSNFGTPAELPFYFFCLPLFPCGRHFFKTPLNWVCENE